MQASEVKENAKAVAGCALVVLISGGYLAYLCFGGRHRSPEPTRFETDASGDWQCFTGDKNLLLQLDGHKATLRADKLASAGTWSAGAGGVTVAVEGPAGRLSITLHYSDNGDFAVLASSPSAQLADSFYQMPDNNPPDPDD